MLDWATLHPVERLELLTTHDLARQEKQKLELLRHLLTYYHYAASGEPRGGAAGRDQRDQRAANEQRDRYRASSPTRTPQPRPTALVSELRHAARYRTRASPAQQRFEGATRVQRTADLSTTGDDDPRSGINGRHRRDLGAADATRRPGVWLS